MSRLPFETDREQQGSPGFDERSAEKQSHQSLGSPAMTYGTPTPIDFAAGSELGDDIAEEVLGDSQAMEVSPEDNKRVLRKLDMILMPMFAAVYMIQYLDKVTYSLASIWGLEQDLHLNPHQYAWGASIFSFGFLAAQFVVGKLTQALPMAKFAGAMIVVWSGILMTLPAAHDATGMLINRFFLGVGEAFMAPVCVLMTGMWYTRDEQPLRTAYWFVGPAFGELLGGLIGYGIGHLKNPPVATWRIIYFTFGGFSVILAILFLILIPDSPANAFWLSDKEKIIALERIRPNMTGFKSVNWKWSQVREALIDPHVIFLTLLMLSTNFFLAGNQNYGSLLVKSFGFTSLQTTLVQAVPSALWMAFTFALTGYLSSKFKNVRLWCILGVQVPSLVGTIMLITLPVNDKIPEAVGFTLMRAMPSTLPLICSLMNANVAGFTKKATVAGLVFGAYSVGLICGSQFWGAQVKPGERYSLGLGMDLVVVVVNVVLVILLRIYLVWENRRRDALLKQATGAASVGPDGHAAAGSKYRFKDYTDRQNALHFRYAL